jgi:hypothetical protein
MTGELASEDGVRWSMDGHQHAIACDAYTRLRDNLRASYLYVREKRKMSNRPVRTGEDEFANARLPPADEEGEAVVAREPPHEVLGVAPDANPGVVRAAARELKKQKHPDNGGSMQEFKRINEAEEELIKNE